MGSPRKTSLCAGRPRALGRTIATLPFVALRDTAGKPDVAWRLLAECLAFRASARAK